jgi:hypothetical protein
VQPDVFVYSDGRVADEAELSIRAQVRYERIGSEKTGNVAIVAMNAKRNYERPTEVQVFARLANYGPEPVNADVQLVVDGRVRSLAATALPPERWADKEREKFETRDSVEFTIDMTEAGIVKVEQMHKQGDALAADDATTVVVPPPKPLQVLLVSEGNYYIEKVLGSMRFNDSLLPAAYEQNKPDKYNVIIFDRYRPKWLPEAGGFIYFGTVPPVRPAQEKQPATAPVVKVVGDPEVYIPQPEEQKKIVGVIDWKRDHPILRNCSFTRVGFADPIKLTVPPDVEVLMEGPRGPLMTLHREGFATHLTCAFDIYDSTWPLGHPSYPVFFQQALQYLAIGSEMDVRPSVEPGATPRINRSNLQRAGADLKSIRLEGPMGSRVIAIPPAGDFALPPLDRVGLYKTDPPMPQVENFAVNLLDRLESNVLPKAEAPNELGEAVAATGGNHDWSCGGGFVACAALPLLLIEWWVYTRRVQSVGAGGGSQFCDPWE